MALNFVKKDGESFPVLVNAAERTDADGTPQFIRLTVFNATDRRRYERELLKARDELKMLSETLEKRVAEVVAAQLRSDSALILTVYDVMDDVDAKQELRAIQSLSRIKQ